MTNNDQIMILGFTDDSDGEDASLISAWGTPLFDFNRTWKTVIKQLVKADHVCITTTEVYDRLGECGFKAYAPHSIIIELGSLVKALPLNPKL